jgi:hypothetical protein
MILALLSMELVSALPVGAPIVKAQKSILYDRDYITSDRFANAAIPSLEDVKATGVNIVGTTTNAEMSRIEYIWERLTAWIGKAHSLGMKVFLLTSLWNEPLTEQTIIYLMKRSAKAGVDYIAFDEFIYQLNLTKQQYDTYFQTALAINKKIQFIITEWDYDSLCKAYEWFNKYAYVRIADDNYNDLRLVDDVIELSQKYRAQLPIVWLIFSVGSQNFDCFQRLGDWMAYVKQRQLDTYFFKIDETGTWQTQWGTVASY